MTSKSRFALSRAHEIDLDEMTALEYRCFCPYIREIFMGCKSEADLPRLAHKYATTMRHDPHDVWIKVVDSSTGKIIACSNWKVYANGAPALAGDTPPEWLEGEELERSRRMMEEMNEARRKANPGGFVHLHICFTDPDCRRQGAGGMMMRWGCDLADQLFLPGWIEASPEGNFLYKSFGFYDFEGCSGGLSGMNMRRDARVAGFEGRKDLETDLPVRSVTTPSVTGSHAAGS